nr:hypothetical protein [Tanacetum cinerariifolium]
MVNVILPDHMNDVPIVEPNQHDDVLVVPELILVDEEGDTEEEEFKEEEEPQEEEDDMEVDIEEGENELKLTYPYEEVDPLNPPPPASESEPEDVNEVKNTIESEDEIVPASVHEVGKAKDEYYGKLILDLGNEVRSSGEQGTTAMEKLAEKLGNVEDKAECKKLKNELEETRFSNTFLRMQNELVERDLYWTRVRAHEFYQEMIRRGFMFEERLNKAIDVLIKDEKSPSSEPIMPPKSAPLTQAAIRQIIKKNVDAAIAAERARHANAGNDARGSRPVMGAVELRRWFEKIKSVFGISECVEGKKVKFVATTLQGPALTWWNVKVATIEHELWNLKVKEYNIVAYTQRFNELALMYPRMVKPKRVKVNAYIMGLIDKIKGEVTSCKPANLNEAVRMAHKLMEQKSQARDERILEGKKQKWENYQSGNSSGKSNRKDNSRQTFQNNQKQGNARSMITDPLMERCLLESLPLCERCFTIKCHKCGKVGHKVRYYKEKSVAMGANAQPIPACYDCSDQGSNVVTGTFLLNNRYASVLFDLGFDRSFVDTKFSFMLNFDPFKIRASYEVELADGRVVSTNTVLKGCTLNLVNHIFEIDLMLIELGTFDVIICMDWLVKYDVVIVCGEKVIRIPYKNKTLIVESDKGVS